MSDRASGPHFVLDSNVIVSAALSSGGSPGQALFIAFERGTVIYSSATVREVAEVLARDRLQKYITPHRAEEIVGRLVYEGFEVDVVTHVTDCRDPKDNKFLELALDGEADAIVTGDQDLLILHPWRGIDIVTPTDFLATYGP